MRQLNMRKLLSILLAGLAFAAVSVSAQTIKEAVLEDKTIDKIKVNIVYNKKEDTELQEKKQ